jgi:hypothetical protein
VREKHVPFLTEGFGEDSDLLIVAGLHLLEPQARLLALLPPLLLYMCELPAPRVNRTHPFPTLFQEKWRFTA